MGRSDGGVSRGEIRRRGQPWGDQTEGSAVGRSDGGVSRGEIRRRDQP